jgi:hypothetical protein
MVALIATALVDAKAAVVTALIFVIDPTAVTMFLNIQKELKMARETSGRPHEPRPRPRSFMPCPVG